MLKLDYTYCIEYDYDQKYDCESNGCDVDGICRCGVIVNQRIKNIDLSLITDEIYEELFPSNTKSQKRSNKLDQLFYGGEVVDKYCIYRILAINGAWVPNNWSINIIGGYYGDEIGGVVMSDFMHDKICEQISKLKELNSLSEKIKYTLKLEYGFLIDDLSDCDFELITIYKNHIDFKKLNQNHIKRVKMQDLTHYSTTNYILPRGVVRGTIDNYSIVDGYHRIIGSSDKIPFLVFKVKK